MSDTILQPTVFRGVMTRSIKKILKLRARSRENRRKLLREAQRLMLEQQRGDLLKFSDVFEAAGVSRGSAYRIYNGIDDLFQDIATEWVNNFVDFLRSGDTAVRPENWASFLILSCAGVQSIGRRLRIR